jgi:hypothetical protein
MQKRTATGAPVGSIPDRPPGVNPMETCGNDDPTSVSKGVVPRRTVVDLGRQTFV